MAENVVKCGKTTIRYPDTCSYVCFCVPSGCQWYVTCGDWTTSGTGFTPQPPRHPSVTIAGKLEVCAKILKRKWKRPVTVPAELDRRTIRRRTFRGTPEQIAHALGLQLGSRRRA